MTLPNTATITSFRIILLISLLVSAFCLYSYHYDWQWWALGLLMHFCYGCLGVTVGHHRLFSHNSFKVSKWKEYVLAMLGALSGSGSTIGWTVMHRAHHTYTDSPKDPHSPTNGFWKVILFDHTTEGIRAVPSKKLYEDKFHRFLHTYYNWIIMAWVGALFGLGGIPLALFGFFLPSLGTSIGFMTVNVFSHLFGYRLFNTADKSTNNPISALLSYGEWHNNHHAFPKRSTTSFKWWEVDIGGIIIDWIKND